MCIRDSVITATSYRGDGSQLTGIVAGLSTISGVVNVANDLDVDGHTNLDNVSIAGVTTTTDDIIIGADNKKLKLGVGEELQLYQAGNHSIIQHNGGHYLLLRSNSFGIMDAAGTKNMFTGFPDTHTSMYYNGSYKIRTQNTGAEIVGTVVATGADINGDLDVDGHTNLDNVSVAGISTFSGIVLGDGSDGNASLNRLKFGASGDLQIYHNQYHSKIVDEGTGALIISGSEVRFETEPSSTETLRITSDGVITGRGELRLTEGTSDVSQGAEIGSLMFLNPANDNKNAKIAALRTTGTSGADLAFYTRTHGDATNSDGGIERLRIDSAGNVGLGTNVVSDSTGNARAFTIARSDANGQVRLILKNQATGFGNGAGYHQGIDGTDVFIENRTNGGYIDFATFDSGGSYGSRLRITSNEIDAQVPITGAVPAPNRNIIENGEFLISQRFENLSSTKANSGNGIVNGVENGVVDRWRMSSPSASNFARQRVTDAPDGFAYSFKVTNDSSVYSPQSSGNYSSFQQIIEATNVAKLAFGTSSAKTVTLSFYVKSSLSLIHI